MASLEELKAERLKKLNLLREQGYNPYPAQTEISHSISQIVEDFEQLVQSEKGVITAGRVMALRGQGGLIFIDLFDDGRRLQGLLKEDELGKAFGLFAETIDIGDFVQISGQLLITKRGEKTIQASGWKILSKALRPLPDQWAGLQDVEERFRRRYLDSLMSEEVRTRFVLRSKIISEFRSFLLRAGYLEVDTPVLQPLAGGATALPFVTHHNALDIDLFLRIAPELYLKKMLIAGFSKVFEIARNFRNEGIDATHNPEFTMMEFYEAYSDATKQMVFVEKMLKEVIENVFGKLKISCNSQVIDFEKKFAKISYLEMLEKEIGLKNILQLSREDVATKAKELGVEVDPADSKSKILDSIYKKQCRPKIIQPTFLVDYPIEYLPLAKKKDDNVVDAFQLVVGGIELVKAFSELNDPIDQKERFQNEEKNRQAGDKEAQPSDEEFVEALEYGMPPAGGVGIGLDRLAMLLTDTTNIKEVIFFPTMRPKDKS